jgi:plasmid stabilization system protein ParE
MSYKVRFNRKAIRDIENSFEWGIDNWGEELALKWLRDLYVLCL